MIGLEIYGLAMKKIDPHICSCESLLELTYADTFHSLDQLFVNGIAKLVHSERVSLCLGEYNEEGDNRILASYPKSLSETGWSPEVAFPIMLSTGQLTHLLLDIDPPQIDSQSSCAVNCCLRESVWSLSAVKQRPSNGS